MRKIKTIISKLMKPMRTMSLERLCLYFSLFTLSFFILPAYGQKIGGNVYGGGNKGNVNGKTTVTVKSGDIDRVFGGARMANVGGRTYVHINGKNRDNTEAPSENTNTGNILINQVYGGNDIAGTIGTSAEKPFEMAVDSLNYQNTEDPEDEKNIFTTYNTFVKIDSEDTHGETVTDNKKTTTDSLYIGSLFAGGNGDYFYKKVSDTDYRIYFSEADYNASKAPIASNTIGFSEPELDKSYLEIDGGSIVYAFGGGNNATIRKNTVIHVDNPSDVVNGILVDGVEQLTDERILMMGINPRFTFATSADYQIGSLFGGNNKATMAIRPTWDLQSGLIRNVYSGGNKGDMTSPVGLLLDVNPTVATPRKPLEINNIYGGCRIANVRPINPATGKDMASTYIDITDKDETTGLRKYDFPSGFAARLLIQGGKIDNVYGGNDIQGKVWGGNAVGIRTSINGSIYGGGNGAYPYTDNPELANHPTWSDLYYNPGASSVDSLTAVRPHAEQVYVHITGTEEKSTIIRGNVFCGGNCATLKNEHPEEARVELKLGSYVTAENIYMGNNGAHMVNDEVLKYYKGYVKDKDLSLTNETGYKNFSTIDLTQSDQMKKYMEAVTMNLKPKVSVDDKQKGDDDNYKEYTSWIGSFFCGGNVGSMTYEGPLNLKLNEAINIYEKIVGGCNNANVLAQTVDNIQLNAAYEGGILGSATEQAENGYKQDGKIKDRLIIDCDKIQIKPKRWNTEKTELVWNTVTWQDNYSAVTSGTTLTAGETYYTSSTGAGEFTAAGDEVADGTNYYVWASSGGFVETDTGEGTGDATKEDEARRLRGGNLYGGCYLSGHVNGNVVINLINNIIDRDEIFAKVSNDDDRPLYDHEEGFKYDITQRNSGVLLDEQGMDEMTSSLSVFGGGYGKDSEIWGSTTINVKKGYSFQSFGGGEQGVIGKSIGTSTAADGTYDSSTKRYTFNGKLYEYNPDYSTTINLYGEHAGATRSEDKTIYMAESEFLYAGGYEGPVMGDTHLYLGNGRIFDAFAGGCNADVLGHSETYVGKAWNYYKATPGYDDGFPYIRDYVYGGSDLGGRILGSLDIGSKFQPDDLTYRPLTDLKASTYLEYLQGIASGVYGGCYGSYDYSDPKYSHVTQKPYIHNSVVNFRPKDNTSYSSKSRVRRVFGAGEGTSGQRDGDAMQEHSYVHVHIPDNMENFASTEVFGAGNYYGVGMSHYVDPATATDEELEEASAIIDLVGGQIAAAYGGSYNEGVTRRTEVNVPAGSTIKIGKIFGGSYGTNALPPCDVYDANVNYASEDALVTGGIYGGNNNVRRTLYSKVNISSPVWSNKEKGYLGTVYGAGYGTYTWSEYTEVNLLPGAKVYEVYGGGQLGQVLNAESIEAYMKGFINVDNISQLPEHIRRLYSQDDIKNWNKLWKDAWTLGTFESTNSGPTTYYTPDAAFDKYVTNTKTNLSNPLARTAEMDDRTAKTNKYNTNVIIHEGANVVNYAYGGGLGDINQPNAGDVLGSTYIALLGGKVNKDIYAAGTTGNVYNIYDKSDTPFVASATAYIKGGSVRNVYGGGNLGSVGKGNYAGGSDNYYPNGYGEKTTGKLWEITKDSENKDIHDDAWHFLNSGIATVNVTGGKVGYMVSASDKAKISVCDKDDLPTGNVFGGCRGQSATEESMPTYEENPDFFLGYVNQTEVNIGSTDAATGPTIYGSVYGGGQDGHVRYQTNVTINKGEIGIPYIAANKAIIGDNLDDMHWLNRGNVYGAGSGIGTYDSNNKDENNKPIQKLSSSSGSITRSTNVTVNSGITGETGGVIYRNVYGGGSLASVGPPLIGTTECATKEQSLCSVTIDGAVGSTDESIFVKEYGGEVYGASRGETLDPTLYNNFADFASVIWTKVLLKKNAVIMGNVFGGGDAGVVKKDTEVTVGN
ncbi:MAG: hypothetical protein K5672_07260 [Bacteroidaceae bacterium]|nr:hypothetical protein [Bacteroidaceae bacterium]